MPRWAVDVAGVVDTLGEGSEGAEDVVEEVVLVGEEGLVDVATLGSTESAGGARSCVGVRFPVDDGSPEARAASKGADEEGAAI